MLKKFFKKLGGGGGSAEDKTLVGEAIEYKGYQIVPALINEDGQFRMAGKIGAERDGEMKFVEFIRADIGTDKDQMLEHTLLKGKQIIDQARGDILSMERL